MVPFIKLPSWDLDWILIDAFGVLVVTACVVGLYASKFRARKVGLDPEEAHTMALWIILGSFTVAHIVAMVFYFPDRLLENPWEIFYIWAPISSLGGFLGALITSVVYARVRKIPFLAYADVFVWGITVAWIFGRMGCSLAHDHPGARSDFFLAVQYPGGARHDLGFYEFLFTLFVLYPLTRILGRKPRPDGFFLMLVPVVYAPVRFVFDFLRSVDYGNVDIRYGGLTAAQWLCILMFLACIYGLVRVIKHGTVRAWPKKGEQAGPDEKASEAGGTGQSGDPGRGGDAGPTEPAESPSGDADQ